MKRKPTTDEHARRYLDALNELEANPCDRTLRALKDVGDRRRGPRDRRGDGRRYYETNKTGMGGS